MLLRGDPQRPLVRDRGVKRATFSTFRDVKRQKPIPNSESATQNQSKTLTYALMLAFGRITEATSPSLSSIQLFCHVQKQRNIKITMVWRGYIVFCLQMLIVILFVNKFWAEIVILLFVNLKLEYYSLTTLSSNF